MGYLRYLKVNELKEEVENKLKDYNKQFNSNYKVVDIYKVPKAKYTWDRIIAKVNDNNKNEKLISVRLFGALDYFGFELIDYSNDKAYIFDNKQYGPDLKLKYEMPLNEYIENNEGYMKEEFKNELNNLITNIKNNNIKKRISKN